MTRIKTDRPAGLEDAPSLAEIEITPEMIERAADELWPWMDGDSRPVRIAERVLRAGLGLFNPSPDVV